MAEKSRHPLVEHAARELVLCGQYDEDPEYATILTTIVGVFVTYGHSGGSAELAVQQLERLLRWQNLAPLTTDPDEWEDRSQESGYLLWQNKRNSKVFSEDLGKTAFMVNNHSREHVPLVEYVASGN